MHPVNTQVSNNRRDPEHRRVPCHYVGSDDIKCFAFIVFLLSRSEKKYLGGALSSPKITAVFALGGTADGVQCFYWQRQGSVVRITGHKRAADFKLSRQDVLFVWFFFYNALASQLLWCSCLSLSLPEARRKWCEKCLFLLSHSWWMEWWVMRAETHYAL